MGQQSEQARKVRETWNTLTERYVDERGFDQATAEQLTDEQLAPDGWVIRTTATPARFAAQTTVGAPLKLAGEPFAYRFGHGEYGKATVLAANLGASTGEQLEVVPA